MRIIRYRISAGMLTNARPDLERVTAWPFVFARRNAPRHRLHNRYGLKSRKWLWWTLLVAPRSKA